MFIAGATQEEVIAELSSHYVAGDQLKTVVSQAMRLVLSFKKTASKDDINRSEDGTWYVLEGLPEGIYERTAMKKKAAEDVNQAPIQQGYSVTVIDDCNGLYQKGKEFQVTWTGTTEEMGQAAVAQWGVVDAVGGEGIFIPSQFVVISYAGPPKKESMKKTAAYLIGSFSSPTANYGINLYADEYNGSHFSAAMTNTDGEELEMIGVPGETEEDAKNYILDAKPGWKFSEGPFVPQPLGNIDREFAPEFSEVNTSFDPGGTGDRSSMAPGSHAAMKKKAADIKNRNDLFNELEKSDEYRNSHAFSMNNGDTKSFEEMDKMFLDNSLMTEDYYPIFTFEKTAVKKKAGIKVDDLKPGDQLKDPNEPDNIYTYQGRKDTDVAVGAPHFIDNNGRTSIMWDEEGFFPSPLSRMELAVKKTADSPAKYLETFFEEKQLTPQSWEIEGNDGQTHFIDSEVVIEAIMGASTGEQEGIANMIRRIDFANGNIQDYLKHLATGLVNGGQYQEASLKRRGPVPEIEIGTLFG